MKKQTLLDKVREKLLLLDSATLRQLAIQTKMSYDTITRIKQGLTDPAFGKVQRLADRLKVQK